MPGGLIRAHLILPERQEEIPLRQVLKKDKAVKFMEKDGKNRSAFVRKVRRTIGELAWKADSACHRVIEWAEGYDPDELLRQVRDQINK